MDVSLLGMVSQTAVCVPLRACKPLFAGMQPLIKSQNITRQERYI
jgi:hypothetical protein